MSGQVDWIRVIYGRIGYNERNLTRSIFRLGNGEKCRSGHGPDDPIVKCIIESPDDARKPDLIVHTKKRQFHHRSELQDVVESTENGDEKTILRQWTVSIWRIIMPTILIPEDPARMSGKLTFGHGPVWMRKLTARTVLADLGYRLDGAQRILPEPRSCPEIELLSKPEGRAPICHAPKVY